MSFWKSTHDADSTGNTRDYRTAQFPGMTVVPDMFSRADGGVVIGVTGEVDLSVMPTVASLVEEKGALGHFHLAGNTGRKLMRHLNAPQVSSNEFSAASESKVKATVSEQGNKLESILVHVENKEEAAAVDASLARMLTALAQEAQKSGTTVVLHLVVDDEDNSARRRLFSEEQRVLEEGNNDGDNDYTYTIPGYYDDNGSFVTPYKTIFQIQYYNVVQWTALGLFSILLAANYMTVNMPLMPDTLLFGESAKMVAE